ncbi:hypothetical protein [Deinococcus pimensis]|uniref:hypothetical protein n=1 Tax=Deinococcus pimensis TaxID=309888 RepID=UPI000488A369|nr:hypothetical protein [Deinococcus pimensis]
MNPGGRPAGAALVQLALLVVLAAVLLLPLLGGPRPPVWVPAALLAARLGIQLWRSRTEPQLRRPGAYLLDAVLIILLVTQGS